MIPLWNSGLFGNQETIAIAAQSDIKLATPEAFWSAFGVSGNQTIKIQTVPGWPDPGETGGSNEEEADLDVEVAGGIARNATLILIPTQDASESAEYAIDNNLAPILSVSFGDCEATLGTAMNAMIASTLQQATAQGMTVLVAAGDQGSAACDETSQGPSPALSGTAVNGLASTPYGTAVGGTDFNLFGVSLSQYWAA